MAIENRVSRDRIGQTSQNKRNTIARRTTTFNVARDRCSKLHHQGYQHMLHVSKSVPYLHRENFVEQKYRKRENNSSIRDVHTTTLLVNRASLPADRWPGHPPPRTRDGDVGTTATLPMRGRYRGGQGRGVLRRGRGRGLVKVPDLEGKKSEKNI